MALSTSKIEILAVQLKLRRSELLDIKATGEQSAEIVTLDQSRVGRLSRMDALQAQAMSQETNRRRGIEIQRIDAALDRIKRNEYGYCLSCDEEIAIARLELDPSSPLCIKCAKKN